jgi:hypothetical protein
MKLDQQQNFHLNCIATVLESDLQLSADVLYPLVRDVMDAKSANTRLYALENLMRSIRDKAQDNFKMLAELHSSKCDKFNCAECNTHYNLAKAGA